MVLYSGCSSFAPAFLKGSDVGQCGKLGHRSVPPAAERALMRSAGSCSTYIIIVMVGQTA